MGRAAAETASTMRALATAMVATAAATRPRAEISVHYYVIGERQTDALRLCG